MHINNLRKHYPRLVGAVDGVWVLEKEKRTEGKGKLTIVIQRGIASRWNLTNRNVAGTS